MVSVIIPTHNYGHFIADTITSVLSQSYTNLECIIVDNGSTDNTTEVVTPFLTDKRLVYIKQENKGVSNARNNAIRLAKGEYMLFLDADDLIEQDKLKEAVHFLEQNKDVDLVYSDMRYFNSRDKNTLYYDYFCSADSKPWMKYISGQGKGLVNEIMYGNMMVICSPVFRISVLSEIGLFDEELMANEDWDLWLRFFCANKKIVYLDKPNTKALVRIHTTSLSKDVFKMQVCGLKVVLKNKSKVESFGLHALVEQRINDHVKAINHTLAQSSLSLFSERVNELKRLNLVSYFFKNEVVNMNRERRKLKIRNFFNK